MGIDVFASLLMERRMIFTSASLSKLSNCTLAALALLYPFEWQHVLIPILPKKMIDFCCSPTPFVVGLLSSNIPLLRDLPMEEVVIVDLDEKKFIRRDCDDTELLGASLHNPLKQAIKSVYGKKADPTIKDKQQVIVEAYLRFMGEVMGKYRQYFKPSPQNSNEIRFDTEEFIKSTKSKDVKKFLEHFVQSQMFSLFIQEREDFENSSDEREKAKIGNRISVVERFETTVDLVDTTSSGKSKSSFRFFKNLKKRAEKAL